MDWKKIGKNLLFPPVWVMLLLSIISTAGLIWVFMNSQTESPPAYVIYVLAFYTLSVVCIFCAAVLPGKYRFIRGKIYSNQFGNRYMTDAAFRTHISLHLSLLINLLYVCINIGSFFLYRSWWFVVLAGYYGILSVMRFLLVRYVRKNPIGTSISGEWKRARSCALLLLSVNLALSGAVLMILHQGRGYEYQGMLIYAMAAYTFYITVHAIVDIIKYRSFGSPVMSMAKVVSLCAALVSVLSLETAMLSQFGADMAQADKLIMIAATGGGVSVIVVAMSAYMIVRANLGIKKERDKQIHGE